MPIYDYVCNSGHETESRREAGVETIPCPACGRLALKRTVYRTSFRMAGGETLGTKYKRYQEASQEIDYTCSKMESEADAEVPNLGLWQRAKQEVRSGNRR